MPKLQIKIKHADDDDIDGDSPISPHHRKSLHERSYRQQEDDALNSPDPSSSKLQEVHSVRSYDPDTVGVAT